MGKVFNRTSQKTFRRQLRNLAATSERLLWYKIRNEQLGYKFRRQHGIGVYVADFYCPALKLVIEIDGACHETPTEMQRDKNKKELFLEHGIKTIRFLNVDIKKKIEGVILSLIDECKAREAELKRKCTPPSPPLSTEEE